MSDQDHGSFFTGLAVGLFAGAAGYFMLKTDDGKKIAQKIKGEWQEAQEYLQKQNLTSKDKSFKTMLYEWFDLEVPTATSTTKKKTKATTKTSKKKTKFKGV